MLKFLTRTHTAIDGKQELYIAYDRRSSSRIKTALSTNCYATKKPKWNIDHPLDQACAELIEVFAIRIPATAEGSIGKYLEIDPATVVFERRLGANDIQGNTHLLRVVGDEQWWCQLPKRLLTIARLAEVHGDEIVRFALEGVRRAGWKITDKNLGSLTRMTPERAADILRRLTTGCAYTRADRESQGVFDTTGWNEVKSRLARGRGSVMLAAAILEARGGKIVQSNEQRRQIATLAMQLKQKIVDLRERVLRIAGASVREQTKKLVAPDVKKLRTFNQLAGGLKQCLKFIAKSSRDIPSLKVDPTDAEREIIHLELDRISAACDRIMRQCRRIAA